MAITGKCETFRSLINSVKVNGTVAYFIFVDFLLMLENLLVILESENASGRCGTVVKNLPANTGPVGLIPGSGRSPKNGKGNGNLLQYSCQ